MFSPNHLIYTQKQTKREKRVSFHNFFVIYSEIFFDENSLARTSDHPIHPTGDVTRVFLVPGKM